MKKVQKRDISSDDDDDNITYQLQNVDNEKYRIEDHHTNGDEDSDDEEEYHSEIEVMNLENEENVSGNEDSASMGDDDDDDDDDVDMKTEDNNHSDREELEKEINDICHQQQDLFRNIRRDPNEDLQKGKAVKNQGALWDKTLEFRFLLQKSFVKSNRLPQEPIRSAFCNSCEEVKEAYSDLIDSTKKTLDSILKLQEALVEKNPSIVEASTKGDATVDASRKGDEEWFKISQMQFRIAPFRDMSVDKWQRKTQVTSGIKNKFQAFNQNISEQVAFYMRDPSRMIKGMQQRRSVVPLFGNVTNGDGDPELLDDSEFYQQLLREFFETINPESSAEARIALKRLQAQQPAFYALKSLQTKKRKIVDRRASKSRKIRYHIHEKIVNFVAPESVKMPPMAPKLFENLFGLKTQKLASVY
ncbi:unnamed protein product [Lactuca virosa]|uniref:Apoptosis-antagonizing transcription factor C-terminal domain-containing protein n=1 Tax=Lactuca virosa TaxID=75947 RepID=A0AAU9MH66_9ASTR|nr:unnamed protein product [Lactuca virosa]